MYASTSINFDLRKSFTVEAPIGGSGTGGGVVSVGSIFLSTLLCVAFVYGKYHKYRLLLMQSLLHRIEMSYDDCRSRH